jgi:ABC-type branched-subunit amino acid transport system permease subunit
LGVIFVTVLQQAVQDFGKWNQIVFGLLIVLCVLFFRGGLWGALQLLWQAVSRRPATAKDVEELAR